MLLLQNPKKRDSSSIIKMGANQRSDFFYFMVFKLFKKFGALHSNFVKRNSGFRIFVSFLESLKFAAAYWAHSAGVEAIGGKLCPLEGMHILKL